MDNPELIAATKHMIRVMVRRPHAYRFLRDYPKAGIPSLVVLDASGKMLGGTSLRAKDPAGAIRKLADAHRESRSKKTSK